MKPTLTHLSVLIFALSVAAIMYSLDRAQDDCDARGGILVWAPQYLVVFVKELKS